ncbi:MAG: hypothetical protein L0206_04070, partial [Actinobacteria bacterium]|nr:hypothetical protein [Actinomycetota bacterium]
GYDIPDEIVEIVGLVVTATGRRAGLRAVFPGTNGGPGTTTGRLVYFPPDGFQETPIIQRDSLAGHERYAGPLIVEEALSTTLVPPGWQLSVHTSGSLLIELAEDA